MKKRQWKNLFTVSSGATWLLLLEILFLTFSLPTVVELSSWSTSFSCLCRQLQIRNAGILCHHVNPLFLFHTNSHSHVQMIFVFLLSSCFRDCKDCRFHLLSIIIWLQLHVLPKERYPKCFKPSDVSNAFDSYKFTTTYGNSYKWFFVVSSLQKYSRTDLDLRRYNPIFF